MEIRHLRSFVAVAEERHFGRAAERLHMAQPPLSQQIKQLESMLGVTLLERTTRRVDLTDAGRLMLDRTRRILADVAAMEEDVREVGRGAAGVLRVGFVGSATYRLMPELVRAAAAELPGIRLHVRGEMLTPELEQALMENRLDLAILRPPVREASLELVHVDSGRLVLALPASHPRALGEGPVRLEEFADEPFVSYPHEAALTAIVQEAARQVGFRPRLVQRASETSTVMAFVSAGMGVAVVPEEVRDTATVSGVVFRELAVMPEVELVAAHAPDRRGGAVSALVDLARRTAARHRGASGQAAPDRGPADRTAAPAAPGFPQPPTPHAPSAQETP